MAKPTSEEGKRREGRGTGHGAFYKPWRKIREGSPRSVATSFPDWKHGRTVELISQGMLGWYLLIRWNDDVDDIRESFPLNIEDTNRIADSMGFRRMKNGRMTMTTDFLVTMTDGTDIAFSVIPTRALLKSNSRKTELLMIEQKYWNEKGIRWSILFSEDLKRIETENIKDIVSYYNATSVPDEIGLVKFMLAHKFITIDLSEEIDYRILAEELKENDTWKKLKFMLD